MKKIDINDIEDGYKLELLRHFLIEKGKEMLSAQSTINEILGINENDISLVVKYLNNDLTIFVGDNEEMKKAVKNEDI